MLLKIREVTAGKFSYFIIAIISVPFALWGINYYFQGGDSPVIIKVESTEITLDRYNAIFNQRKRELEASPNVSTVPPDEAIKRDVIGALVRDELLKQTAEKYRYQVSDAVVAETIVKMPEFMDEGKFDKQQYFNLLNANRRSQSSFEEGIREQLRKSQLHEVIDQSSFTLPHEKDAYNKLLFQERRVRYLEFPMARFIDSDSVSSTETRAYYEDNKKKFMYSDAFYLRYIELKMDDIYADLTVEEGDVRAYYDDNLDIFTAPEQRTVAHILIDPDRHEAPAERAQEVYAKLQQGEDFADLAKAYSDDSLTADKGGELLPLTRGDLDDVTEEAIFALAPGEFSEPVSGDFGLQIFKLISAGSSEVKTFEEVRDVVKEELRREKAETIYSDNLDQIENLAYSNPDNLSPIVEAVEYVGKLKTTGLIRVDEAKGIFQYPAVVETAYTDAVRNQLNSPVLEVEPGYAMVIRGGGGAEGPYRPGEQKSFEQVEQEIIEVLLQDKAWEQASQAVEETAMSLRESNVTLDELAKERSLPLHDTGFIRRGDLPEMPAIEQIAFLMQEVTTNRVNVKMEAVESYAIVEFIDSRQSETPAVEESEDSKKLSFALEEFNAILLGILEEKSVEIYNDRFGDESQQ